VETQHNWRNANQLLAACFLYNKKYKIRDGLASNVHSVVAMESTTNPWYLLFHK